MESPTKPEVRGHHIRTAMELNSLLCRKPSLALTCRILSDRPHQLYALKIDWSGYMLGYVHVLLVHIFMSSHAPESNLEH